LKTLKTLFSSSWLH